MARARAYLFSLTAMLVLVGWSLTANATTITTSEYTFSGACTDCTGFGTGDLVLAGYTPGTAISSSNFVSYNYRSNLISYSITSADLNSISGNLSTLPGQDTVAIFADEFTTQFISNSNGHWCTGGSCVSDFGSTHTWSVTAAPEPASLALLGLGIAALGAARRRR